MMMHLCCDVVKALSGKTLVTAESCTGGGIGAALTAVPGSSTVFKGGIISYTNWVKEFILNVPSEILDREGAVSARVAEEMSRGVRNVLCADYAISVTGLAGPGGDDFGNPVGTVYIGYCDDNKCFSQKYLFQGSREDIRAQAIYCALELLMGQLNNR